MIVHRLINVGLVAAIGLVQTLTEKEWASIFILNLAVPAICQRLKVMNHSTTSNLLYQKKGIGYTLGANYTAQVDVFG